MNELKKRLIVFCVFLVIALVFWRGFVFLFYDEGEVSFLRGLTGLNIHHYHYGIVFVLISGLMFIFYKADIYSVALMGFGFGTYFDGFVSRLLGSSVRQIETTRYNQGFSLTILVFFIVILLSVNFYLARTISRIN